MLTRIIHREFYSHFYTFCRPSVIQTWLTHSHLFLSLTLCNLWNDFQFNFALNPRWKLNYERFWTHWTPNATPVVMTPFALTSWRTRDQLTQRCCRRSQTSRSSCHSDSTCTVQKNFSSPTPTTDSWVCFSSSHLRDLWPRMHIFTVAPTGDHVISLIDEISYLSPPTPLLSQYDDINPEQFCNGDNRPANCGANCMCTHKVDIPLNAIVEVVLVDEVQQPNLSHPL